MLVVTCEYPVSDNLNVYPFWVDHSPTASIRRTLIFVRQQQGLRTDIPDLYFGPVTTVIRNFHLPIIFFEFRMRQVRARV
jgi:hypothetical protein